MIRVSLRRLPFTLIACLLALVSGSTRVAAQGPPAPGNVTVTRWDIFATTGGSNGATAAGATRNVTAMVVDGTAPASPDGSRPLWVAGRGLDFARLGRLDPFTDAYTQWSVGEAGVIGGLAVNEHPFDLDLNPGRGDVWMALQDGFPSFIVKLGDAPDTFRKFILEGVVPPRGIVVAADGAAYAAVPEGSGFPGGIVRIRRDDANAVTTWSSPTLRPREIALDPNGTDLWFTNIHNNTLGRFEPATETLTEWALLGSDPSGLRIDGPTVCVVSRGLPPGESGEVQCVNTVNHTITVFQRASGQDGFLAVPQQVAISRSDELFVTEQGYKPDPTSNPDFILGNAMVFIGQQAYLAMSVTSTARRTDPAVSVGSILLVNQYDEQCGQDGCGPLALPALPVPAVVASFEITGIPIGPEDFPRSIVRFPLPLEPQADLEDLDRFPQPWAITPVVEGSDEEVGRGVVFVAESFEGPIGRYRGARIDRFELLPPRGVIAVSKDALTFEATVDDAATSPASDSFEISNSAPLAGAIQWTATVRSQSGPEPFVLVLSSGGDAGSTVSGGTPAGGAPSTVGVSFATVPGLEGQYTATIAVSGAGAMNTATVDVALNVNNAPPQVSVSSIPDPLTFSTTRTVDASGLLTIGNDRGSDTLFWRVTGDQPWLDVEVVTTDADCGAPDGTRLRALAGDASCDLNVRVANHSGLEPGTYTAAIGIASNDPLRSSINVPVELTVTAPTIEIIAPILDFAGVEQGDERTATVTVRNVASGPFAGPLTFAPRSTSGARWLSVTPPGELTVQPGGEVNLVVTLAAGTLAADAYRATITIADPAATNTPAPLSVSMTVIPAAVIAITPNPLEVTATKGVETTFTRSVKINNTGSGTLNWSAEVTGISPWLSIVNGPPSGTAPATLMLAFDITSLAPGVHTGTVEVSSPEAGNAPQTLTVKLTITGGTFQVTPSSLNVTVQRSRSDTRAVRVTNVGGAPLNFALSAMGGSWLTATLAPGSAYSIEPGGVDFVDVIVSMNTTGLAPNLDYTGSIVLEDVNASTATVTVPVTLHVDPLVDMDLVYSPPLSFSWTIRDGQLPSLGHDVTVRNTGDVDLNLGVSLDRTWAQLSPASMTVPAGGSAAINFDIDVFQVQSLLASGALTPEIPDSATLTIQGLDHTDLSRQVVVTLTVPKPPAIGLSPLALTFQEAPGQNPASQELKITNTGGSTLVFAIDESTDENWSLNLSTPGTNVLEPGQFVTLMVSPTDGWLSTRTEPYMGTITVRDLFDASIAQTATVALTVKGGGAFQVTPSSLNVTVRRSSSDTRTVRVTNVGGVPLNFALSTTGGPWLTASLAPGSDSSIEPGGVDFADVIVSMNATGLAPNQDYAGAIVLEDVNGAIPTVTVPVTVHVDPLVDMDLVYNPPLSFSWTIRDGQLPSLGHDVTVRNTGDVDLNLGVSIDRTWARLSPASMTVLAGGNATINVDIDVLQVRSLLASGALTPGIPDSATLTIRGLDYSDLSRQVVVTLTVPKPPAIGLSPSALTFQAKRGQNPTPQELKITNTGGSTLEFAIGASTGGGWTLNLSTPGTNVLEPGQFVTLMVSPASSGLSSRLAPYMGTITVRDLFDGSIAQTATVALTVKAGKLTLAPAGLTFFATRWTTCNLVTTGKNPASQDLVVTNTTDRPFWYLAVPSTSSGGEWLAVKPETYLVPPGRSRIIKVSTNVKGLAQGTYEGAITVYALSHPGQIPDTETTEFETVSVTLTVGPAPATLCVSPKTLNFGTLLPNSMSAPQDVQVGNAGDGALGVWTAKVSYSEGDGDGDDDRDHGNTPSDTIVMSPTSGTGTGDITVSIKTGKKEGSRSAKITISAPGAAQSPQTVQVTWKVKKPGKKPHLHK